MDGKNLRSGVSWGAYEAARRTVNETNGARIASLGKVSRDAQRRRRASR